MTNQSGIADIFEAFRHIKVLVVGDVMVDNYIFGNVNRISPEAPIPIVDVYRQESRAGGAANVALNLKAMGANVMLASVIGDDDAGHEFKTNLQQQGIDTMKIVLDQERRTTVKSRVISRNQHILRFDYEQRNDIDENTELLLLDNIIDAIYTDSPNVVILQDYNKGVMTKKVIQNIMHHCKQAGIPTAVDPKRNNFFEYKGCTIFKPNLSEAKTGLNMDINSGQLNTLINADGQLRAMLQNEYSIITLSSKGIFIGTDGDHDIIPALYRNIIDVSGAGDTVISVLALGLALDLDMFATAELANIAAGLVCEEVGVAPVNKDKLIEEAVMLMETD